MAKESRIDLSFQGAGRLIIPPEKIAFLFYRETEVDEPLTYTSQNLSFDVVQAKEYGWPVSSETRTSSVGDIEYRVYHETPFLLVSEYANDSYAGPTYEVGEYDVFCIPLPENSGMFATIDDARNGRYQENVHDFAGDGSDEDDKGGRKPQNDPDILNDEKADCFWVIVDNSVPDSVFLNSDNFTLVDVSADVFFNSMWTPEGVTSVEKKVSGWSLLIKSSPTSGIIFSPSSGISIGDNSCPLFFDVTATPPSGSCNIYFAGELIDWDASYWDRTTLKWKYSLSENNWGYVDDEKTIPGSMHEETFGLSSIMWWAANIDVNSLEYCGNLPGKNTYYGGGFDYINEPYFNLIDDFDLKHSFVEPSVAGYDIYGLFGAKVAVKDMTATEKYIKAILDHWGVTDKKVVFIGGRTRWGCGGLGGSASDPRLPTLPPELLETFEVPQFYGRYAQIILQIQVAQAVSELILPIRFFHRVTKMEINTLPTSGGSIFDFCNPEFSEPFAGFVDMISSDKAIVRIYYEPCREWFEGGKRMKERTFPKDFAGAGSAYKLQPFGFVGGHWTISKAEDLLSEVKKRVNPKKDYYKKCKIFEVKLRGKDLIIVAEEDLTYPNVPNYPNLNNNSEKTYIINDFEIWGNNLQFTDAHVQISGSIDNTRDLLFCPPNTDKTIYMGLPGYFQIYAFDYTKYGLDPSDYPERLTDLSRYTMSNKIIFNLLGKPFCNYTFREWTGTYEQYDIYKINGDPASSPLIRPYKNKVIKMPGMFDVDHRHNFLVNNGRMNTGWDEYWLMGIEQNASYYWDTLYWEFANLDEQRRGTLFIEDDLIFWYRIKEISLPFMFIR